MCYGYINIYNIIILVRINTFLKPNIYKGDEHHLPSIGVFLKSRQTYWYIHSKLIWINKKTN